ncbi:hypothetical protein JOF53_007258 [Crossiella equi]|uniref:DUF559 domain-containing protein n=1 Tax=Crossiella equi TaxID=130796 RepID=A0ABS5APM8_9PSEU|nr:DUF559 domain-containing protein [Crossiella equi]MBP2478386.1 hypothetical protein [Crossiella equi]
MNAVPLPIPCTRPQAVAALGERGLRSALSRKQLVHLWSSLLVPASRLNDHRTRAVGALLLAGPESALTGPTAAQVYGWTSARSPTIHVTVPYSRWSRSRPGLVMHHDRFSPDDVLLLDGLRVLAPPYVLVELLCGRDSRAGLACTDEAFRELAPDLREQFRQEIGERLRARDDRRGVPRAQMLLDLATGLPESPAESSMLLVLVDGGFPPPVLQHEIRDTAGDLVYRLDFAWPDLRVALEHDGYEAHELRADQDAERDRRLAGRGWLTVRAAAADLAGPEELFARLRRALKSRGWPG